MTPTQFRAALDRLGLSQLGAARLFGVDGRTVRRWVAGDRSIPEAEAVLLRLMLADKISQADIRRARLP